MLNERYDGSIINEGKVGLARELARMNLTLNTYTQWYWKTDLLNLMNFLRLRADHHAQYEIRTYADAMLETVKKWVPITYEAFMDYRVGGTEVSSKGKKIIQKLIKGEKVNIEDSGLSKREWNELMEAFNLKDLFSSTTEYKYLKLNSFWLILWLNLCCFHLLYFHHIFHLTLFHNLHKFVLHLFLEYLKYCQLAFRLLILLYLVCYW